MMKAVVWVDDGCRNYMSTLYVNVDTEDEAVLHLDKYFNRKYDTTYSIKNIEKCEHPVLIFAKEQ